jgi:membrane protein
MSAAGRDASGRPRTRAARLRRAAVHAVRRLVRRYRRARVSTLAAALAYYAAFSLGPLLLLLGGWLGSTLRARPELAARYREALAEILAPLLPEGVDGLSLVERSFEVVLDQLAQGTLLRGALSLLVLLWASSGFFASLQRALEVIFEVPETRGFLRTRAVALLLIAAVALVIALELIGGTLATWAWRTAQSLSAGLEGVGLALPDPPALLTDPGPLRLVLAVAAFAACFRWLPRRTARWDGALLGAVVSVAGLQLMRVLLPIAFDEARFNLVYGVIASLVVLLLWLYLALLLFLLGALVAAEASAEGQRRAHRRARRRGEPEPGGAA